MAPKATHRPSATRSERRRAALQRRRRLTATRSTAARDAARRRRRLQALTVFAAVALVAGTAVFIAVRRGDGPAPDLRAERVAGAVGPLAISTTPASYRLVYRAEAYEGSKATVSTEEILVQRPFDARVAIREGAPPGGAGQFEGRSSFGVYANYTEAGAAQVAGDAPTVALGDIRLAPSLADLVAEGLFVLGERRRALGRECQVYRTGSPLQSLRLTAPTSTDYTDACIDGTGLVLEEVTVVDGKLTQRLTATEVETDVALDPSEFTIEGARVGPDQGGSEVSEVDRAVAPTPGYWALDTPPAGYTHRGRYRVEGESTSHVDVYVRGADLITVRQGPPAAEPDSSNAPPGHDVDLGVLGAAKVVLGSTGPTVIAHPQGEAFVHVTGTVAPAELQAIAAGLRRAP
jgi:hypothetical protein